MGGLNRVHLFLVASIMSVVLALSACVGKTTYKENEKDILEVEIWDSTMSKLNQPVEDLVTPVVTEKTGVRLSKVYLNEGRSSSERMNLFISGGEIPDLIKILKYEPQVFMPLAQEGLTRTVTAEDIKKYAPDIAKRLNEQWYELFSIKGDGKEFYGIPIGIKNSIVNWDEKNIPGYKEYIDEFLADPKSNSSTFLVREDILKKVYPHAPTWDELKAAYDETGSVTRDDLTSNVFQTFDQLEDFLYKVKGLNLTEGGKEIIPYMDASVSYITSGGLYAQTGIESPRQFTFNWASKEYELPAEHDNVKALMKRINKWTRDGIIPTSMGVNKSDANQATINSGIVAVTSSSNVDLLNKQMEALDKPFRYRTVFLDRVAKSEPGYHKDRTDVPLDIFQWLLFNKNLSTEQYHKVLGYVNYFSSDQGIDLLAWGPESAGLYEEIDGKRRFVTPELENNTLFNTNNTGEKNFAYYGLSSVNNVFGNVIYGLGSTPQPNNPIINYYGLADRKDRFNTMAAKAFADGSVSNFYTSWDWLINDTVPEIIEIRTLMNPISIDIRNSYITRLIFAENDDQFERLYQELEQLPAKRLAAHGENIDDIKQRFADAYMKWYDDRGIPYPEQNFKNDRWK